MKTNQPEENNKLKKINDKFQIKAKFLYFQYF